MQVRYLSKNLVVSIIIVSILALAIITSKKEEGSLEKHTSLALSLLCMEFTEPFEGKRYKIYHLRGHPHTGIGFNLNRSDASNILEAVGSSLSCLLYTSDAADE